MSASVSGPTPVAGAGLKIVIAPAALAHSEGLGRRGGRDLVPDEHDIAGPGREALQRLADVPGFEGGLAPPATAMLFSPRESTRISATPVAWSGSVRSSRHVHALGFEGRPCRRPMVVGPDRADERSRAPSRAAATAWFPPLPPWCWANRPPVTVSPGRRQAVDRRDEVHVDGAHDDDPPGHGATSP